MFSRPPPSGGGGVKPSRQEVYLTCSRTDADLSGPASVPGDNNGCSKGLRSNSVTGSLTPRQNRSPCRPHPQYRFIQPGALREWELSMTCAGADLPAALGIPDPRRVVI